VQKFSRQMYHLFREHVRRKGHMANNKRVNFN
jgi:hypothetical protein